ncbi:AGC family protein kinase [Histomonas meleagridis]|uniref:AGC family protein kinase n=1 Tax=Histomonas meleagridis TaxID=135588 RepID=UPI00355A908F|nr:AGC family protein kinase [Histomonas meleagridis]KAH0806339.1 AGC family protein kinase [Histomonas meleagridis]
MSNPVKEGWLSKQGGLIKTWKKRWFSLVGSTLHYSEKQGKKEQGYIDLKPASTVELAPESKKQPAFKIVVPGSRTFLLLAPNKAECQAWVDVCEKARIAAQPKAETQNKSQSSAPSTPKVQERVSLDDFDLIRVLGRGTYGKVQLVRFKRDHELYAMKTMSKRLLEETEQIEQTITERNVLLKTKHPFLVSAHYTFQTPQKIFMVLDYVPGGELFGRLKDEGRFSEKRTILYAAEILLGLGALHKLGFIYRDLKPENILVDAKGHLKITDFGLVKTHMNAQTTTTTFCGTPEYIAPEMLQQQPYTRSVDWWSYGILVFEMLTGLPPFYDENTNKMYRMILTEQVVFPSYISQDAKDFISRLLDRNPSTRMGASEEDAEEIKRHPFFSSLNFDDVLNKRYTPEWIPVMKNETDTHNFDEEFTQEEAAVSFEDESLLDQSTQQEFVGFTCTQDSALDDI